MYVCIFCQLLHSMGQYSEALDLYLHQLEAATQVKDALQIACAKGNLGLIFQVACHTSL